MEHDNQEADFGRVMKHLFGTSLWTHLMTVLIITPVSDSELLQDESRKERIICDTFNLYPWQGCDVSNS